MIVPVRDVALRVDDTGRGMPVLFIHGFPFDRTLWSAQRRSLASRLRCIVPDLRGFGESTGVAHDVDTYADDLVALLDALEIDDAAVCGMSMGGYIAMALWRRHPQRVRGLVLCSTRATADTDAQRTARNASIALAQAEGVAAVADASLPKFVSPVTRTRHPAMIAELRAMMVRQRVGGVVGALQALRDRPDSRETLASITVPTLVLVGEDDEVTPPADAAAMLALLPPEAEGRLETVAGAGHLACLERPAAVTHALADFLATLAARP